MTRSTKNEAAKAAEADAKDAAVPAEVEEVAKRADPAAAGTDTGQVTEPRADEETARAAQTALGAPATSPPDVVADRGAILVASTRPGGHWRAGRAWTATPEQVDLAALSDDGLRQLQDDPHIVIVPAGS